MLTSLPLALGVGALEELGCFTKCPEWTATPANSGQDMCICDGEVMGCKMWFKRPWGEAVL